MASSLLLAGCGPTEQAKDNLREGQLTIKRLAILYGRFVGQNGGRPPRDEAELRKFVEANKKNVIAAGAEDANSDLMVSPRDGKPYVVPYAGADKRLIDAGIAAHEQEGVGGERMVAFTIGAGEVVDEAEFEKILAGRQEPL